MVQSNKISIQKTAHYYSVGKPTMQIKNFWIACHGYGQLAKNFIHKFESIEDGETFVVAPEGLSRFYWKGFSGDVGASWMTKEDRLDEIEDYAKYLQTIYDYFLPQLNKNVKITLFGFSQGCATQCRWLLKNFPLFHHLVLWAGVLPEDLDYLPHQDYFKSKTLSFVVGEKDEFLTEERLEKYLDFVENQQLHFDLIKFAGKHEVDRKVLQKLADDLKRIKLIEKP